MKLHELLIRLKENHTHTINKLPKSRGAKCLKYLKLAHSEKYNYNYTENYNYNYTKHQ